MPTPKTPATQKKSRAHPSYVEGASAHTDENHSRIGSIARARVGSVERVGEKLFLFDCLFFLLFLRRFLVIIFRFRSVCARSFPLFPRPGPDGAAAGPACPGAAHGPAPVVVVVVVIIGGIHNRRGSVFGLHKAGARADRRAGEERQRR